MHATIRDCRLIPVPTIDDERGSLSFLQQDGALPFVVQRVYYMYGASADVKRGGHGNKATHTALICMSGTLQLTLFDGKERASFSLDSPKVALYRPAGLYLEEFEFGPHHICMALASALYDPEDQLYGTEAYLQYRKTHRS